MNESNRIILCYLHSISVCGGNSFHCAFQDVVLILSRNRNCSLIYFKFYNYTAYCILTGVRHKLNYFMRLPEESYWQWHHSICIYRCRCIRILAIYQLFLPLPYNDKKCSGWLCQKPFWCFPWNPWEQLFLSEPRQQEALCHLKDHRSLWIAHG